jgi:hypothetical protein
VGALVHPHQGLKGLLALFVQPLAMLAKRSSARAGFPIIFFDIIAFGAFVVVVMHRFTRPGGMEWSDFHSRDPFVKVCGTLLTQPGLLEEGIGTMNDALPDRARASVPGF